MYVYCLYVNGIKINHSNVSVNILSWDLSRKPKDDWNQSFHHPCEYRYIRPMDAVGLAGFVLHPVCIGRYCEQRLLPVLLFILGACCLHLHSMLKVLSMHHIQVNLQT